jgi:spermidine/putrescine transport system ATP-binding protein
MTSLTNSPESLAHEVAGAADRAPSGLNKATSDGESRPPAIRLTAVTKRYEATLAVDALSIDVADGEFFALLGPSGCGKTTTLKLIAGFEQPTAGQILIQGAPVQGVPAFRRNVNMVFQNYALFPHLNVRDNVAFGLRMKGLKRRERYGLAGEALETVHLPGLERRKVAQLSGGQQQRVALARALINRPAVLLLDEPLGALDLKLRKAMQLELKNLQREVGISFVYVTHDQEEALSMADRIAVMNGGRALQVAAPREIYERPANRFVASFIGASSFLTGAVEAADGDLWRVRLESGEVIRATSWAAQSLTGRGTVMVRPENVLLRGRGERTEAGENTVAATVEQIEYVGSDTYFYLAAGSGERLVSRAAQTEHGFEPGAAAVAVFRPEHGILLPHEEAQIVEAHGEEADAEGGVPEEVVGRRDS